MNRQLSLYAVLGAALLLSACSRSMSDLEAWVVEVKARKTTQIDPIPQMKQYEAYAYVGENRRDPFIAAPGETRPNDSGELSALRPDLNRSKEPLEEFPIDALRLVGVVTFNAKTYAMVKAPDSVIHRVTTGDHLGQNYGRINRVSEAEVSLTEIIPDGFGGFIERAAALAATE
ncbi:pilus assembly protein PilP [Nevskia sp.]|uniref:pilus assembly protein PilP n=1 Tax=Nevskia sp. TaxID=1929292 RepID=UPI0025DC4C6E|nr:pilus assembly protein PilP [Nevskia sp.]